MHVHMEVRVDARCPFVFFICFKSLSTLFFETRFLSDSEACHVGLTGWPANPQNRPALPIHCLYHSLPVLGLQACATHPPGFYMSAGASKAGLTAHTANTSPLSHLPSPLPLSLKNKQN